MTANASAVGHDVQVPSPETPSPVSVLRRRRRWLWVVVATAVVLAVACVLATRWIKSPAQVAADAAPPARTVLTAPVTMAVVESSVVGRGSVVASVPMSVSVPVAEDAAPVISAIGVPAGGTVNAGDVVLAVSGRPVIVLTGTVPAYRDLKPGDVGPDVTQFQGAVTALGISTGKDTSGTFGPGTAKAVQSLYDRVGYQVVGTSGLGDPTDPAVVAAKAAVTAADRAVEDLRAELAQARAAAAAAPAASSQQSGTTDGAGTGSASAAEPVDVAGVERRLARAVADRATAAAALSLVSRTSGPMVPRGEVAYLPTTPALVMSVGGALGGKPADPLVTFNGGALVVSMQLDAGNAALVRAGMPVRLDDEVSGWSGTATVTSVGPAVSKDGAPAQAAVLLTPDAPLDGKLAGANLRVTVSAASSGTPVLAVPVAAVTASADGSTYVVSVAASGDQSKVVVKIGVTGNGLVQVTPVTGTLVEGDLVVTSR